MKHSPRLESVERIGLLGDVHGDLLAMQIALDTLAAKHVAVAVQLGDFGVMWPTRNWGQDLDHLSAWLAKREMTLYWLDGNHEWLPRLQEQSVGDDGLAWLRPRIAYMPRGWRTTLADGTAVAILGGAGSVDRPSRSEGVTWWPEEVIIEDDLLALGSEPADLLLGHDAARENQYLAAQLARTEMYWSGNGLRHAAAANAMYQRGFEAVRPKIAASGRYHHYSHDQFVTHLADGQFFHTRGIVLDTISNPQGGGIAIVDLPTGAWEILSPLGEPYALTGTERGRWRVVTQRSEHVFDFDAQTVQRFPGPDSRYVGPGDDGQPRRLLQLVRCEVGKTGFWFAEPELSLTASDWHQTSWIRRIERISTGYGGGIVTDPVEKHPPHRLPALMTSGELADYLRVPQRTIESWRLTGIGPPYVRAGRRVFYREDRVSAWLDSRSEG